MAIEFAPPATPLPSMNTRTAKRVGHRRPKTNANWPKKGIKTVLYDICQYRRAVSKLLIQGIPVSKID